MSIPALDNILLRTLSDPNYPAKGSTLTWIELDTDIKTLADVIASLANADNSGFSPYDNTEEYSNVGPDYVTFNNNIWQYINAVPQTGITPGTDSFTWQLVSLGQFTHEKNKDQYLDFGGPFQVSAEDIFNLLSEPPVVDKYLTNWSSSFPYSTGDTVLSANLIWIATSPSTNELPGSGGNWDLKIVNTSPYGVGWSGSTNAPTQDAVYDAINSLTGEYLHQGTNVLTEDLILDQDGYEFFIDSINTGDIKTSYETWAGSIAGYLIQNTNANASTDISIAPNGSSESANLWLFGDSGIDTDYSALKIGNESLYWAINSVSDGSGFARNIYINATGGESAATANIDFDVIGNTTVKNLLNAKGLHVGLGANLLGGLGATQYIEVIPDAGSASYLLSRPDTANAASADFITAGNLSSGYSLQMMAGSTDFYLLDRLNGNNIFRASNDGNIVFGGDVEILNSSKGLIMEDSNGLGDKYRITILDGSLNFELI